MINGFGKFHRGGDSSDINDNLLSPLNNALSLKHKIPLEFVTLLAIVF